MSFPIKKKGIFALLASLFVIAVVIVAAALLLPSKILHPWLKTKIRTQVAALWQGEFDFQQLHVQLLPRPKIFITHGHLTLPGGLNADLGSFELRLALVPLFKGDIRISRIDIRDSRLVIHPTVEERAVRYPNFFSFNNASESLQRLTDFLSQRFPGLLVSVKNSTFVYERNRGEEVAVSDIAAILWIAADKVSLTAGGYSTMTEMLQVDAALHPKPFSADGKIIVEGLNFTRLLKQIHLTIPNVSTAATLNGRIEFKADENSGIAFTLDTHAPEINLLGNGRRFDISNLNLSAAGAYDDNYLKVELRRLTLSEPSLNLQGNLQIIDVLSATPSFVQIELLSDDLDLSAVRAALAFAPGGFAWSRKTLEILKGGRIPRLKLSSTADSFKDLLKPECLQLKAGLDSVRLQLPWLPQELTLESGEVEINERNLKAEELVGIIGNSRFRQSRVAFDIGAGSKKFESDLDLTADLKDFHTVLLPILKKGTVAQVVAGITQIKGETSGHLKLNNINGPLEAVADLSAFQMRLSHKRLPEDLIISSGKLHYHTSHLSLSNIKGEFLKSRVDGLEGAFDWAEQPAFNLKLSSGIITVSLAELFAESAAFESLRNILEPIETLKGICSITEANVNGPLMDAGQWIYSVKGNFKNIFLQSDYFPGPLTIAAGDLKATPSTLSGQWQDGRLLDAALSGTFLVKDYRNGGDAFDLDGSGEVGPTSLAFFRRKLTLPPWVALKDGVTLDRAKIHWESSGKIDGTVELTVGKEMRLYAAGSYDGKALRVENLRWQDAYSRFQATLKVEDQQVDYAFDGYLSSDSFTAVFPEIPVRFKRLEGRLHGGLDRKDLCKMHAEGRFTLADASYFVRGKPAVGIKRLAVTSVENHIQIETAELAIEENAVTVSGHVHLIENGVLVDLDISADRIDLALFDQFIGPSDQPAEKSRKHNFWGKYPIEGIVRWRIKALQWNALMWSDLKANVAFNGDYADLHLAGANLCGVTFSGRSFFSPDEYAFEIRPAARQLSIQSSYHCLHKASIRVDGSFDLEGEIKGRGKTGENIINSLNGSLRFSTRKGRVYQDNILTKILAFINLTEVFAGERSDWGKKGVGFESAQLDFSIINGKVKLTEGLVNGNSMTISGQGSINPVKNTMDLTVLVAPFKTIDRVVQKIPIVNYILAGSLVSIPLRVKGALASPEVIPLAPGAVGEGLVRIMKRTLKAPFKIIPFTKLSPSR